MNPTCYVCKYTPTELLSAYGGEPLLLDQAPENFERSDQVAHPNLCGFGKSIIQAVLSGQVKELVLVNCCDSIRSVYDVLKESGQLDFLYMLDLLHHQDGCSVDHAKGQLLALAEAYGRYKGTTFDKAAFFAAFAGPDRPKGPYIAVLGAHMGQELFSMTQALMPLPAENGTCANNRNPAAPEDAGDFDALMEGYARSLLGQLPCMRMADTAARKTLYNDPSLAGVVYHTIKFCDYYGFEYAGLKDQLSVPLLKLESDGTRQSQEQLRTRLEAFAEGLQPLDSAGAEKRASSGRGYFAGIDSGSTTTDVVILDQDKQVLAKVILPTGAGATGGAARALDQALAQAGLRKSDLTATVTTGYGRSVIHGGDKSITEITCHAKGAHFLNPAVRTVVDIGGQDSKVIRLDENGGVANFVMNDKCAAGTGRFLEMMARTLELSLEEISTIGLSWKEDITISSMCTVFADSEVVSLVAQNKALPDIVHGLNRSVAARAAALFRRVKGGPVCMMTGGVARNAGVVSALEEALGLPLFIHEDSQLCGALGAALFALEM
ncbi:MAG: acyl-CoA dehydratase activase [Evtepia sp.]